MTAIVSITLNLLYRASGRPIGWNPKASGSRLDENELSHPKAHSASLL
ncbi:MAG: hypothetical protein ACLUPV_06570 [Bilophila wadsworthia]